MERRIGIFVSDDGLSEYVYKKLSSTAKTFLFSFFPVSFAKSVVLQPGDISGLLLYLKKKNVSELVFIGRISPETVFSSTLHPSGKEFLGKENLLQGERILGGLVSYLAKENIRVFSLTEVLKEELAVEKVYTVSQPGERELQDIETGVSLLKDIVRYRAGQSAAVKNGMVIAVEGVEGTDGMIKRIKAYQGCEDFVVVKIAGANKDERFDIPVAGPETIRNIKEAGGRVIAVEAGKTVIFDEKNTVSMCNENGITLMGINIEKKQ